MPAAARVSDLTITNGVIIGPGVPNVLIGGLPAAVLGDFYSPPPGTTAPPSPITGGNPTVLIGGKPAAIGIVTIGMPTVQIG